MEKKICSKCQEEKEVCEFYKHSKNPNIYRGQCKICMNKNSLDYHIKNSKIISEKNKQFRIEHPEINKEKCQIYKKNNPDYFKKWLEKNKEHRKNYINNYNSNPKVRIKNSLRSRVNELINKKYNNPKTLDLVGCDYEFLMIYIENKFIEGMSWGNYGYYGWHLDHIIPLSSAKTKKEIYKLYHYTNLQPLWAEDNLKKSDKILN
jgi:hypothetical protein